MAAPWLQTKLAILAFGVLVLLALAVFGVPAWAQESSFPLDKLAPLYQSQRDANAKQAQDMAAANAVLGQQLAEAQAKIVAIGRDLTGIVMPDNAAQAGGP